MIREKFYKYLLNKCTKENNITTEQYIYASKKNNSNGMYEKAKCADACMFGTLQIVRKIFSYKSLLRVLNYLTQKVATDIIIIHSL